jgi:hypothetical protein
MEDAASQDGLTALREEGGIVIGVDILCKGDWLRKVGHGRAPLHRSIHYCAGVVPTASTHERTTIRRD